MEVFRHGPEDRARGPNLTLRDDGLLLVQSSGPPRFYFSGETEARTVSPPAPTKLGNAYTAYEVLGKSYFLGGVPSYERTPYPSDLMIGFIKIDAGRKGFGRNLAVLEVVDSIGGSESWALDLRAGKLMSSDEIPAEALLHPPESLAALIRRSG